MRRFKSSPKDDLYTEVFTELFDTLAWRLEVSHVFCGSKVLLTPSS